MQPSTPLPTTLGWAFLAAVLAGCSGSTADGDRAASNIADAGETAARSASPAGVPGPPAPEVTDDARAPRRNPLAAEGKVPPEWLPQGFTLRVLDETGLGSEAEPLYLMCTYNEMDPAAPHWRLTPQADGSWQIFVPEHDSAERLQLLVTRGSIETAQARPGGTANAFVDLGFLAREHYADDQPCVRTIVVKGWRDAP